MFVRSYLVKLAGRLARPFRKLRGRNAAASEKKRRADCEFPDEASCDRSKACREEGKKGRGPSNDDPHLEKNIPLDDQRASLVAGLITAVDILPLREQIRLLDARKSEDEFLAS